MCGFCVKLTCTHSLDEDVRLLDGKEYFSGYVAQLPCAPAQKIGTCCQNLWELPWGFEMQHWGGRLHKGSECEGSSSLGNVKFMKQKKEKIYFR